MKAVDMTVASVLVFAVPKHLTDGSAVRVHFTSVTFPRGRLACDCTGGSPARRTTHVTLNRVFNQQCALRTILETDVAGAMGQACAANLTLSK